MKWFKYVFVIIVVMILSGCTVSSNINVSSSGKVSENVKIVEESSNISENSNIISNYLNSITNKYKKAFEAKNYSYNKILDVNKESGLEVKKDYDNICEFVNDTGFSQYLYKKITCSENDYYYEIKSEGENIFYCPGCSDFPHIDKINLNITLPVRAEEDNSDNVSGNTYTWVYDKETNKSKSIYLKVNKSEMINQEKKDKENEKSKKTFSLVKMIGIILTIILLLIITFYTLYKKYKNNKLEY